jgi:hypothetical protein
MLAGSLCSKHITAQGRPYTPYFVGSYAHAYPAAAYQNALVTLACRDCLPDFLGDVRIIHRFGVVGAEILIAMAGFLQQRYD